MNPYPFYAAIVLVAGFAFTSAAEARSSVGDDAREVKRISIAYVNDIHAQLEPHPELYWNERDERVHDAGGLSRIATAFKQLEAERPHGMLRIDGGDTFQGSGPGAWTNGEVMVHPMNALKLDVAIPGNWSVAYGAAQLRKIRDALNYPMVAANMVDRETGQRTFEPYLVKEINGIKVGMLGFTDPDIPTRQPPHMSEGLAFEATEVLQPLIDELRNEHEVDLVVLITHIGLHKAVPLTAKLQGVDISLSSDTHERTYEPIAVGDAWVVEAGAFGSLVGVLDLTFENGKLTDRQWELIELRREAFPEDEEVKAIVDKVLAPHRERMNLEIGYTDVWLERYNVTSTSMDRLIADAVRDAAGTDIALSNGFRFSPPTAPGPITEGDLWNWLPMNLDLKVGEADGHQLIEYWESEFENVFSKDVERLFGGWLARPSTNMQVRFDSTAPAGKRLRGITIDGQPLDPDKSYTLAAGARKGSPDDQIHRVKRCRGVQELAATTHEAVRNYLAKLQGKSVPQTGPPPVRCVVRPDIVRSQYLEVIKNQNELRENEAASIEQ
jgi:2',3'-cyclic-nucleotide 2'-phosphodiesterase (5'-nucleotidase family)